VDATPFLLPDSSLGVLAAAPSYIRASREVARFGPLPPALDVLTDAVFTSLPPTSFLARFGRFAPLPPALDVVTDAVFLRLPPTSILARFAPLPPALGVATDAVFPSLPSTSIPTRFVRFVPLPPALDVVTDAVFHRLPSTSFLARFAPLPPAVGVLTDAVFHRQFPALAPQSLTPPTSRRTFLGFHPLFVARGARHFLPRPSLLTLLSHRLIQGGRIVAVFGELVVGGFAIAFVVLLTASIYHYRGLAGVQSPLNRYL